VGGEFDKLKLKIPWANPGTQGFGDPGMELNFFNHGYSRLIQKNLRMCSDAGMDVTFILGRAEINPGDTSTHDPVGGDGRVCACTCT
jgi:hypothetical protein